jgi:peptidyl-prolyl cis-trans isomerase A (cyclophilin A)
MNSGILSLNVMKNLAVILLIPMLLLSFACKQNEDVSTETTESQIREEPAQDEKTEAAEPTPGPESADGDEAATTTEGGNPMVIMKTSKGDIKIELYQEEAPITVENFLGYVNDGFYDNTIFHRVINNFMVQGGGISTDMQQKPVKEPIKNEARNGLTNDRGTLAMARTGDIDSATAQFFINHADNDFLNHGVRDFGYAVFGKVVDGMDVVDEIAAVKVGPGDVPEEVIILESVTVVE